MLALRRNTAHPALFRWRCDARRPPHLSVQRFSRHPLRSPTRLPLTNSYIFRSNFSTKLQDPLPSIAQSPTATEKKPRRLVYSRPQYQPFSLKLHVCKHSTEQAVSDLLKCDLSLPSLVIVPSDARATKIAQALSNASSDITVAVMDQFTPHEEREAILKSIESGTPESVLIITEDLLFDTLLGRAKKFHILTFAQEMTLVDFVLERQSSGQSSKRHTGSIVMRLRNIPDKGNPLQRTAILPNKILDQINALKTQLKCMNPTEALSSLLHIREGNPLLKILEPFRQIQFLDISAQTMEAITLWLRLLSDSQDEPTNTSVNCMFYCTKEKSAVLRPHLISLEAPIKESSTPSPTEENASKIKITRVLCNSFQEMELAAHLAQRAHESQGENDLLIVAESPTVLSTVQTFLQLNGIPFHIENQLHTGLCISLLKVMEYLVAQGLAALKPDTTTGMQKIMALLGEKGAGPQREKKQKKTKSKSFVAPKVPLSILHALLGQYGLYRAPYESSGERAVKLRDITQQLTTVFQHHVLTQRSAKDILRAVSRNDTFVSFTLLSVREVQRALADKVGRKLFLSSLLNGRNPNPDSLESILKENDQKNGENTEEAEENTNPLAGVRSGEINGYFTKLRRIQFRSDFRNAARALVEDLDEIEKLLTDPQTTVAGILRHVLQLWTTRGLLGTEDAEQIKAANRMISLIQSMEMLPVYKMDMQTQKETDSKRVVVVRNVLALKNAVRLVKTSHMPPLKPGTSEYPLKPSTLELMVLFKIPLCMNTLTNFIRTASQRQPVRLAQLVPHMSETVDKSDVVLVFHGLDRNNVTQGFDTYVLPLARKELVVPTEPSSLTNSKQDNKSENGKSNKTVSFSEFVGTTVESVNSGLLSPVELERSPFLKPFERWARGLPSLLNIQQPFVFHLDRPSQKANAKISFSRISSFLSCPAQYLFKYVLNLPASESIASSIGVALHAVMAETRVRSMDATAARETASSLRQKVESAVRDELRKQVRKQNPEASDTEVAQIAESTIKTEPVLQKRIHQATKAIHDQSKDWALESKVATEVEFSLNIAGTAFVGQFDSVEIHPLDGVTIYEYKTHIKDRPFYKLLQARIYAYAYYKTHDQIPKRVVIKSLSHEQEHVLEPTEEDIQQTKAFLHKMVNKLQQTRAFVARPSRACNNCQWSSFCPAASIQ